MRGQISVETPDLYVPSARKVPLDLSCDGLLQQKTQKGPRPQQTTGSSAGWQGIIEAVRAAKGPKLSALEAATASSKHQSLIMRSRSLARSVSSKICSKLETSTARGGSEHHNHHAPMVVYQTITSGSPCAHTTRLGCFPSGHQEK